MKLLIQPKIPFHAGGNNFHQIAGDMFVDDDNFVFLTWNGALTVVIARSDIAAAAFLPEDCDIETLKGTDYIFVADPLPSAQEADEPNTESAVSDAE